MLFSKEKTGQYAHIVLYGLAMAALVLVLKWLQWKFLIKDNTWEVFVGLLAVFFTGLGIWIATQLIRPKTIIVQKEEAPASPTQELDLIALKELNLSQREYEVLELINRGHSNAEIADQLCVSLSTVKTHVSNVFVKLDVKSRTKAIEKAKRLNIVS